MSVDVDIEQALNIKLSEATAFPVVYQNDGRNLTTSFYSCEMIPAETDTPHYDFNEVQNYEGIFQINFYNLIDTGRKDYFAAMNEIKALFYRGLVLTNDTASVLINKVYVDAALNISGDTASYDVTPISIYYTCKA